MFRPSPVPLQLATTFIFILLAEEKWTVAIRHLITKTLCFETLVLCMGFFREKLIYIKVWIQSDRAFPVKDHWDRKDFFFLFCAGAESALGRESLNAELPSITANQILISEKSPSNFPKTNYLIFLTTWQKINYAIISAFIFLLLSVLKPTRLREDLFVDVQIPARLHNHVFCHLPSYNSEKRTTLIILARKSIPVWDWSFLVIHLMPVIAVSLTT